MAVWRVFPVVTQSRVHNECFRFRARTTQNKVPRGTVQGSCSALAVCGWLWDRHLVGFRCFGIRWAILGWLPQMITGFWHVHWSFKSPSDGPNTVGPLGQALRLFRLTLSLTLGSLLSLYLSKRNRSRR